MVRTAERVRAHYEIERELADRLRVAPRERRGPSYAEVYDELFRRVPDHPQLTRRADPRARAAEVAEQIPLVARWLTQRTTFVELGAGDCGFAFAVAPYVARVYAVDVSLEIAGALPPPPNAALVLSDGTSVPVPPGSVDLAYSNQLVEHLHPEDAVEHTRNVARALASGGRYICVTPNRLSGPHDVSAGFASQACGLHLKEYTTPELVELFRAAGFARVEVLAAARGRTAVVPAWPLCLTERALQALGAGTARRLVRAGPLRKVMGVVVGTR